MTIHTRPGLFDLPVHGDIPHPARRDGDLYEDEFAAYVQPLIDDPDVAACGWHQDTHEYSDDRFNPHGLWVRTAADAEALTANPDFQGCDENAPKLPDDDPYERLDMHDHPRLTGETPEYPQIAEAAAELKAVLEYGSANWMLLARFGDPASVTIANGKVTVTYYDPYNF